MDSKAEGRALIPSKVLRPVLLGAAFENVVLRLLFCGFLTLAGPSALLPIPWAQSSM